MPALTSSMVTPVLVLGLLTRLVTNCPASDTTILWPLVSFPLVSTLKISYEKHLVGEKYLDLKETTVPWSVPAQTRLS